jgi:hypothetical protein
MLKYFLELEYSFMSNLRELLSIFLSLIERQESEILDFKRDAYNLSREDKKLELVKDIVCMYNTPRDEDAHIILGVKEYTDRPKDLFGIDLNTINSKHLDQSSMQSIFHMKDIEIEPFPVFRTEVIQYGEKTFAIITIPFNKEVGPCRVIKSRYDALKSDRNILYFRRGTDNDHTKNTDEVYRIMQWFRSEVVHDHSAQEPLQWDQFLDSSCINGISGFDLSRKYILITSPLRNKNIEKLPVLGEIPATLVLDFDPQSDIDGLLHEVQGNLKRSLHTLVKRERPTINPDGTTYWFFVRGLEGKEGTLETGNYKAWKKSYSAEIVEQLRNFAKAISPVPITCIILWYETPHLIRHLQTILNSIQVAFEDAVEFVIATQYPGEVQEIENEIDIKIVDINLNQLCSGLDVIFSSEEGIEKNEYLLPSLLLRLKKASVF